MTRAKLEEIVDLFQRGTFALVLKPDMSEDANVVTARFALAIKNPDTEHEVYKARFFAEDSRTCGKITSCMMYAIFVLKVFEF
jgi:hypothetical protein